jgi:hypothetical protein
MTVVCLGNRLEAALSRNGWDTHGIVSDFVRALNEATEVEMA